MKSVTINGKLYAVVLTWQITEEFVCFLIHNLIFYAIKCVDSRLPEDMFRLRKVEFRCDDTTLALVREWLSLNASGTKVEEAAKFEDVAPIPGDEYLKKSDIDALLRISSHDKEVDHG